MPQLDTIVCDHIENPLQEVLASIPDRRKERAERRREHIAELSRRAAVTELRLKRLYEAIGSGVADLNDPALRERVVPLRTLCDQAQTDSERAQAVLESVASMVVAPARFTQVRHLWTPRVTQAVFGSRHVVGSCHLSGL
ncbi:hypothetical protein [Novosphingobium resinovorum]|uniref:hypothetical protein n=1 Tax=Novosphingobium resinovorum TaxID=158500 RepID=UPI002ED51F3C|nr:hypothetical protein [Novosphingobium resinovorum]